MWLRFMGGFGRRLDREYRGLEISFLKISRSYMGLRKGF